MTSSESGSNGVQLFIDSLFEDVFLVGLAVRAYADYLGFDDSEATLVELAAVEAVNNAIKHACGGEPGHRVDVEVTILTGWLIVTVSCMSSLISDFAWPSSNGFSTDQDSLSEGGRGVEIINRVMDVVFFETVGGQQVLTMKKRRPAMR